MHDRFARRPPAPATFVALLLLLAGAATARAEPLASPYDVAAARAAHGKPAKAYVCKAPPAPPRDLLFDGFYADGTGSSVVDPARLAAYQAASKTVDDFRKGIVAASDAYVAALPVQPASADCALGWLAAWAAGDAMLGRVSSQGGYVRKWTLGTVASAFLKVRDEAARDLTRRDAVLAWMRRLAEAVRADYSTGTDRASRRNNHLYWAAWSTAAAAVALDDRELLDWAMAAARSGLAEVTAEGTLPLEMERRSKALHYHLFAVAPLVMLAEIAARNGLDLYAENDGALHRLIRRTVAGLDDPGFFAAKSGHAQDWVGSLTGNKIAWMEAYARRFPDPALTRWMERLRPLKESDLGGNLTVLYARGR